MAKRKKKRARRGDQQKNVSKERMEPKLVAFEPKNGKQKPRSPEQIIGSYKSSVENIVGQLLAFHMRVQQGELPHVRIAAGQASHWASVFTGRLPSFQMPPFPQAMRQVWQSFQFHRIGGAPVPIAKTKVSLHILGLDFNFALVSFPHFPG